MLSPTNTLLSLLLPHCSQARTLLSGSLAVQGLGKHQSLCGSAFQMQLQHTSTKLAQMTQTCLVCLQILDSFNHDYTVEWFTETSGTQEGEAELIQIRQEVPNLSLRLDTDLLWNWHQMAAADVLVMSLSGYTDVPEIVNKDGILIRPIPRNSCKIGPHGYKPSNCSQLAGA